ncbi:MAG: hypothetical protein KatS3mg124_2064 [Porticoccaceae bacterium]|nr:MAG: hypothetical protein KatS3mg124_2064 [Porticoccaceae bacterium]
MRRLWALALAALLTGPGLERSAAAGEVRELDRVRAAFVYHLAKLIHWPAEARSTKAFRACLYRRDFLGGALTELQGRPVAGRPLTVEVIAAPEDAAGCRLVLVAGADLATWRGAGGAGARHRLVVADLTEAPAGESDGAAAVALVRRGDRLGLVINRRALARAGLTASSELLKLAHLVEEGP